MSPLWDRWFRCWSSAFLGQRAPVPEFHAVRPAGTACPHCTNLDTLSLHCQDGRCGWVRCTCGALVSSGRRHRHPGHGSDRDTCHDPRAAV